MRLPHHVGAAIVVGALLVSHLISDRVTVRAQDPDSANNQTTEHGIDLFRKGDLAGAVKVLESVLKKRPDDADAWYYLGLANFNGGNIGRAGPAFQRLIELRPNSPDAHAKLAFALILANEPPRAKVIAERALELGDKSAEAHYAIAEASLRAGDAISTVAPNPASTGYLTNAIAEADAALRINPNFVLALITKSFAQRALIQYPEAIATLEKFLVISPDDIDATTWRAQLDIWHTGLTQSSAAAPSAENRVFNGKDVTQKARVLTKPEPQYTEPARKAWVTGTVILRVVFASNGEVRNIFVQRALAYGLTTQAIKAARLIRFEPAVKDGHPVSMYIQLEYNFSLY